MFEKGIYDKIIELEIHQMTILKIYREAF